MTQSYIGSAASLGDLADIFDGVILAPAETHHLLGCSSTIT
jgi:hypothetical protein